MNHPGYKKYLRYLSKKQANKNRKKTEKKRLFMLRSYEFMKYNSIIIN